jgi:hypothetical protein
MGLFKPKAASTHFIGQLNYSPAKAPGYFCDLKVAGISVYTTICISVNAFVFYAASCVFVAPKTNLPPCSRKGFCAAASVPGLWPAGQVTNKQSTLQDKHPAGYFAS